MIVIIVYTKSRGFNMSINTGCVRSSRVLDTLARRTPISLL